MKYERVFLCIAVILLPIGTLLAVDPAAISDVVGLRQMPYLEKACALYEAAKQDLVRLNGGHLMGIGVVSWILRGVQDSNSQRLVLKAFLASAFIGMACSLHALLGGNTTTLIWVPVGIQGLVIGLLVSGIWRLRQTSGTETVR
jgi:hypothetical protein